MSALRSATANAALLAKGLEPLPEDLTLHSLRRTFASLLYAIGQPPTVVMAEMGHTSPTLALSIYAKAMHPDAGEPERLAALVGGEFRHSKGTEPVSDAIESTSEAVPV